MTFKTLLLLSSVGL